jgi:hypothetical protein
MEKDGQIKKKMVLTRKDYSNLITRESLRLVQDQDHKLQEVKEVMLKVHLRVVARITSRQLIDLLMEFLILNRDLKQVL